MQIDDEGVIKRMLWKRYTTEVECDIEVKKTMFYLILQLKVTMERCSKYAAKQLSGL